MREIHHKPADVTLRHICSPTSFFREEKPPCFQRQSLCLLCSRKLSPHSVRLYTANTAFCCVGRPWQAGSSWARKDQTKNGLKEQKEIFLCIGDLLFCISKRNPGFRCLFLKKKAIPRSMLWHSSSPCIHFFSESAAATFAGALSAKSVLHTGRNYWCSRWNATGVDGGGAAPLE